MQELTDDEIRDFLLDGTRTGKLAWVGKDGRPHVTPIWFLLDGDDIVFNTHETSGKAKALTREGRACMVVDLEAPPYAFVKIDASVSFDRDPDRVRELATRIGGRYMGEDQAEAYGERNGGDGEWIVRLTPTRIRAFGGVSD